MRGRPELLEHLAETIRVLFGRVRVHSEPIGFRTETEVEDASVPCESAVGGLLGARGGSDEARCEIPCQATVRIGAPVCVIEAPAVLAAMDASTHECIAAVADTTTSAVDTLVSGPSAALTAAPPTAASARMAVPRIVSASTEPLDCRPPRASLLDVVLPTTVIETLACPLPRLHGRSRRADRVACRTPLTRGPITGGVTPAILTQAMRALVARTGLPPRSLRLLGVFGSVPLAPISRLEVQSGGKRVRLWYAEGARAPAAARLAVARGLDDQRIYAAVLPPE